MTEQTKEVKTIHFLTARTKETFNLKKTNEFLEDASCETFSKCLFVGV